MFGMKEVDVEELVIVVEDLDIDLYSEMDFEID